ncbi:MAG: hypothetical protein ACLSD3_12970 [Acutalibacteraceae bacterium]
MNDDQSYFFYPEDLKKKARFFAWTGINITIIAACLVLSCFIFFLTFAWFPLLLTVLSMILTATNGERSVFDYIWDYVNYLFIDQLEYIWSEPEPILARSMSNATTEESKD